MSVTVKEGAPPTAQEADVDFGALVADILEHPERARDPTLSDEVITEVARRMLPYNYLGGPPADTSKDFKRVAAACFTNLREDYLRRFTATSLIGFLFQLLHEWEVPVAARRWTPPRAAKKGADSSHQPCPPGLLVAQLEAALAVAREAQGRGDSVELARRELADLVAQANVEAACGTAAPAAKAAGTEAAGSEAEPKAEVKAAEAEAAEAKAEVKAAEAEGAPKAEEKKMSFAELIAEKQAALSHAEAATAGLLYAATHAAHRVGLDMSARLRATAESALRFPAAREVVTKAPMPPPPGQMEVPPAVAKDIIGNFLRRWLEFDPSVHVRAADNSEVVAAAVEKIRVGGGEVAIDTKDPGHLTLEALRAAPPPADSKQAGAVAKILESPENHSAALTMLRDEELALAVTEAMADPAEFMHYLGPIAATSPVRPAADVVPPQDTFHRWAYYTEVNFEALRTVTEALYPERPDLDVAVALWDVFEGSQTEVDRKFQAHIDTYQDTTPSTIRAVEFGGWTLMGDFKKNREKISFYNKNTEVIKRILDRHAEDKRLGSDLMRKRVYTAKAENIASDGPDAPGLAKYKRALADRGQTMPGAEKVVGPEAMRRLEAARGDVKAARELEVLDECEGKIQALGELEKQRPLSADERQSLESLRQRADRARDMLAVPDNAVQIDVFTTNAKTGEFSKSHFYTEAEAPEHLRKPAAGMPPLAPYAAEHQARELAPRSDAERKAEATRDAPASGTSPALEASSASH